MISEAKIKEVEAKDFALLSEEDRLIWHYWNAYREANLWYNMMINILPVSNCMDLAFNYAKKGKDTVLLALNAQSKLMAMWANNPEKIQEADMRSDVGVLKIVLSAQTQTIAFVSEPRPTPISPNQMVTFLKTTSEQKNRDNVMINIKEVLKSRGLIPAEDSSPVQKINNNLKILDNLYWTGKITESMYNKKCRELHEYKKKIA